MGDIAVARRRRPFHRIAILVPFPFAGGRVAVDRRFAIVLFLALELFGLVGLGRREAEPSETSSLRSCS